MGAKLYADTATKTLVITAAPVSGLISIDAQVDVWSDLIEDWESTLNLRRHTFPLLLVGGQTISAGKLGSTYVLLDPWQIAPYEADHDFEINGNLFTELTLTKLVLPTVGAYTVTVNRNLSTLVEVVETGTSGLTAGESAKLDDIDTNTTTTVKIVDPSKHTVADGTTGNEIIYDDDGVTPFRTYAVTDENDQAVALSSGDPAKKVRQ